jgi:hypothetical protein
MASQDSLRVRELLKKGTSGYNTDDTAVALRIRNKVGSVVTHVITAGTTLELHDAVGTETIDLTAAATNTLGELVDYINTTTDWEAVILDGLVGDSVNAKTLAETITPATATVVDGVTYYDIKWDTDAIDAYTYRLTRNRHTSTSGKIKPSGSHRVSIQEVRYYAQLTTPAANQVQIWECDGGTETQLRAQAGVNTTVTTINFAAGNGKIDSSDNCDLVVRVKAAAMTDNALSFLEVTGILE